MQNMDELRRRLSDALSHRGKSDAVVHALKDSELLEALEDAVDLDEAREALAEVEREGTVSWDDLKAELGLSHR